MGLNIGADDYIETLYSMELLASQFPAETVQKVPGYAGGKGTEGKRAIFMSLAGWSLMRIR